MSCVSLTRCCSAGWKHFIKTRNADYSKTLYHCWSLTNVSETPQKPCSNHQLSLVSVSHRYYTKSASEVCEAPVKDDKNNKKATVSDEKKEMDEESMKKMGLFQKFKQMYRDYWYVLIPVHVATSSCWAGLFYYAAKSGIDVIAILEWMKVSTVVIDNIRDSNMGYIALTYALYKIATPARYAVTLAGTTLSINYLKKWGYLKPVPSREKLKDMYNERKVVLQEKYQERKDDIQDIYRAKRQVIKDKKRNLWEDIVKRSQNSK